MKDRFSHCWTNHTTSLKCSVARTKLLRSLVNFMVKGTIPSPLYLIFKRINLSVMTKLEVDTGVKNDQAQQIFKRQTAFPISFQETLLPPFLSSKTSQKSQAGKHDCRVLMIETFLKIVWLLAFGAVFKKNNQKGRGCHCITKCNIFSVSSKRKNSSFWVFFPIHSPSTTFTVMSCFALCSQL